MKAMKKTTLAVLINTALFSAAGNAADAQVQDQSKANQLEVISVTARKRVENAQEIPVSVSALQGDNLDAYSFSWYGHSFYECQNSISCC